MIESSDRVAQFKAEVAEMRLADPALARDRALLRVAVALLVIGPAFAVAAYMVAHFTKNPLQQRDAIVSALLGVSLSVVGGALYLRYSLAGFLRFWLARLTYEQKAQTDRMVDVLDPARAARAEMAGEAHERLGAGPLVAGSALGNRSDVTVGEASPPPEASPSLGERRSGSRSLTQREG